MPPFTILNDAATTHLLTNLSKPDISLFQHKLEQTLLQFSTAEERKYQPPPGIVTRPNNGPKSLFRPFTSPTSIGTKIIIHPAAAATAAAAAAASTAAEDKTQQQQQQQPLRGVLILCDNNGYLKGLINAAEVTGFRTSLSAIIPFTWRTHVENVVIFGAGKQALWHLRLALTLRGGEIKRVTLVNRTGERARRVVESLRREGRLGGGVDVDVQVLEYGEEDEEKVRGRLARADVVFCTVPSKGKLFSVGDLELDLVSGERGGRRMPYVAAIGSWTPDMLELDPELLCLAVERAAEREKLTTGLIVDDREGALMHSGEVVRSGLQEGQMLELGEVIEKRQRGRNDDENFTGWLRDGLVVYKSIGVSLTDKAAGEAILELAAKQGVGQTVSDF